MYFCGEFEISFDTKVREMKSKNLLAKLIN